MTTIPPRTIPTLRPLPGLERMRQRMFGSESRPLGTIESLATVNTSLADATREAAVAVDHVQKAADTLRSRLGVDIEEDLEELLEELRSTGAADPHLDSPLTVVLMGRTQSGKSTLFEFLTGGQGDRMGEGGQRTSRDVAVAPCVHIPGMLIVDTPGVGAADGAEDYRLAFDQVPDADLILWVASSEPTHSPTAEALQEIAQLGKPLAIVLNCRAALGQPLMRQRFLTRPEKCFDGKEDHLKAIHRPLATVPGRMPAAVLIHAQAALLSQLDDPDHEQLWRNSRVEDLFDVIRDQTRLRDQRKWIRATDSARNPVARFQGQLSEVLEAQSTALRRWTGEDADTARRQDRALDAFADRLAGGISRHINGYRSWRPTVSVDDRDAVAQDWQKACEGLAGALDALFEDENDMLAKELEQVAQSTSQEWSWVMEHMPPAPDLPTYATVWPNRILRALTTVGPGLLLLVPQIGLPVAILASLGSNFFGKGISGVIDRMFKPQSLIRRERRNRMDAHVAATLDIFQQSVDQRAEQVVGQWRIALKDARAQEANRRDNTQHHVDAAARASDQLLAAITQMDTALARVLAGAGGRRRLADSITSVARIPNLGVVAETNEDSDTETRLFPLMDSPEQFVTVSTSRPAGAPCSVGLLAQFTPHEIHIDRLTPDAGTFTLLGDDLPTVAHRTGWQQLIQRMSGERATITTLGNDPREDDYAAD